MCVRGGMKGWRGAPVVTGILHESYFLGIIRGWVTTLDNKHTHMHAHNINKKCRGDESVAQEPQLDVCIEKRFKYIWLLIYVLQVQNSIKPKQTCVCV